MCGKAFPYRESLVTHSSLHTGIKSFQCECCARQFSCIGNLIKHRRTRPGTCGLPQYKNIKCAPRASTKGELKKGKKRKNYKTVEPTICSIALTSTPSKSTVAMEEYEESCDEDEKDNQNDYTNTPNTKASLKAESSYETTEADVVYLTASDNYMVTDIPTKNDELILATSTFSQSEQIIVLETQEIMMASNEDYDPLIVEETLDNVKGEHEFHELVDGKVQQYQIISADELIDSNRLVSYTYTLR